MADSIPAGIEAVPTDRDAADYRADYSDDGVDLSVIRWMLSLTPAQRLGFLEQRINDVLAIRALNARH